MSDYRRAYVPGGCYFFTVVTHHRQALLAEGHNIKRLRDGFRHTMEEYPFQIDAIVILPDHLHTVWRLPDGDADFSLRWRLIKHHLASGIAGATNRRGEKSIWQRRLWEYAIRDEDDWRNQGREVSEPIPAGARQRTSEGGEAKTIEAPEHRDGVGTDWN